MSLFRPSELHAFLQSIGKKANKRLSQNFLIDGNILRKMVDYAKVQPKDAILEIGPGPGALTEMLLERGARVTAVEKDCAFAASLSSRFPSEALSVISEDFLTLPLEGLYVSKVVANLPYQITSPILARLVPLYPKLSTLILMVQKEVALRMVAKKGTKDYSSLTLFLSTYADIEYGFTVEPTCFYPPPKVHSAVVKLHLKTPPRQACPEFFALIRHVFQKRRKMLRSSLRDLFPPHSVEAALASAHINPQARPEELSLEDFFAIFDFLQQ